MSLLENDIYNLVLDVDLNDQFVQSFKVRQMDQKFLYLDFWANLYYKEKEKDYIYGYKWVNSKIIDWLGIWKYFEDDKKNLFVGLGCGKSYMEDMIFKNLLKKWKKFDYFWVDSSKAMLAMSIDTLRNCRIDKKFILSDFFSRDFKNEIFRLSEFYDNRLYAIFNNTFGNLAQSRMINNLSNILRKWDKIWIDVRMNRGWSVSDNLELFNKYCDSLKNITRQNFFDGIFSRFNIPKDNYSYYISTRNDEVIGALVFDFIANFSKKTSFDVYWNRINILPGEDIKITHIYTYNSKKLILFFEEHWFKIKSKYLDQKRGHFIFEKI